MFYRTPDQYLEALGDQSRESFTKWLEINKDKIDTVEGVANVIVENTKSNLDFSSEDFNSSRYLAQFAILCGINYLPYAKLKLDSAMNVEGVSFKSLNYSAVLNNAEVIPAWMFAYCADVKTIVSSNAEKLGHYGFLGCTKLKEVYLPRCYSVHYDAFFKCTNLELITFSNRLQDSVLLDFNLSGSDYPIGLWITEKIQEYSESPRLEIKWE